MKRILIVLLILVVAVTAGFSATNESRALNVYGQIGVGGIVFGVTESTTVLTPANLLADAMNPNETGTYAAGAAPGVKIGSWSFTGTNQEAKTYTLTYTFAALANSGTTLAYQINEDGGDWLDSTDTTTYSALAGSPTEDRDIYARLTVAGRAAAAAAPAGTYTSTITVNLTSL